MLSTMEEEGTSQMPQGSPHLKKLVGGVREPPGIWSYADVYLEEIYRALWAQNRDSIWILETESNH